MVTRSIRVGAASLASLLVGCGINLFPQIGVGNSGLTGTARQVLLPALPQGGQPPTDILGLMIGPDGVDNGGMWEIQRPDPAGSLDLLAVSATSSFALSMPLMGGLARRPPLALSRWKVDSPQAVAAARSELGPPPYSLELRNFSLDGPPYWVVTDQASRSVRVDAESGQVAP